MESEQVTQLYNIIHEIYINMLKIQVKTPQMTVIAHKCDNIKNSLDNNTLTDSVKLTETYKNLVAINAVLLKKLNVHMMQTCSLELIQPSLMQWCAIGVVSSITVGYTIHKVMKYFWK